MTKNTDSSKIGKGQLIDAIREQCGLTKAQAESAVVTMLDTVIAGLRGGRSVALPGLGTMTVRATAARTGVKPGTSEKIDIPAGKKVSFKVSSTLKDSL